MTLDLGLLKPALAGAEHVYVGILTKSGPHVTPELFTLSGGRIVCMTAASTLKVKVLGRNPITSVAAISGGRRLTAMGTVELLDPASPATALEAPGLAAQAPLGVARFVRDNAAELAGAAMQALTGKLGRPLPPRRVILAITVTAATIVDGDEVLVAQGWDGVKATGSSQEVDAEAPDLTDVPERVRDLAVSGSAVVGWTRSDGSALSLPATWDASAGVATVPTALFRSAGAAGESPACLTFDRWTGYGPEGKQGVMLRGSGRSAEANGVTRIALDVNKVSHWDGIEVGTTPLTTDT